MSKRMNLRAGESVSFLFLGIRLYGRVQEVTSTQVVCYDGFRLFFMDPANVRHESVELVRAIKKQYNVPWVG